MLYTTTRAVATRAMTLTHVCSFRPTVVLWVFFCAGATEWQTASNKLQQTAAKKKNLSPEASYLVRVRAHTVAGWGDWSGELGVSTVPLETTIQLARRKAKLWLYQSTGTAAPPPLPTPSAPHVPPPMFPPEAARFPSATLSLALDPRVDNRWLRLGLIRARLLEQSFDLMADRSASDWARGFLIGFQDEQGVDYGALTRDWLVQLLDQLSDPRIGLFTQVSSAVLTHPSTTSVIQPAHLKYFRLFGLALAKAFLVNTQVKVRLSKLVLKALLGRSGRALDDLQFFDDELHRSLVWMMENDLTGVIEENFCTTITVLGEIIEVELLPNGSGIPVTEQNKAEFVELKARAVMLHGISDQMDAIRDGFGSLVPAHMLKDFSVADLHVALSGVSSISVHDWRRHTVVSSELAGHKTVVDMFWQVVGEMSNAQRSKLLYFATASVGLA